MRTIRKTLKQFEGTLSEIQEQTRFIATAHKLIRNSNEVFNWNGFDDSTKDFVLEFLRSKFLPQERVYEAFYVLVFAHYEQYIRVTLGGVVDYAFQKKTHFDKLNNALVKSNLLQSGRMLSLIDKHPRISEAGLYQIARNLGTFFPGSKEVVLNSDAFMFFATRVSPDEIERLYKMVGISEFWDDIGRSEKIQSIFEGKSLRRAGKKARDRLKSFADTRNKIVHRGDGIVPMQENDVYEAVSFFYAFGRAFTDMICRRCAEK